MYFWGPDRLKSRFNYIINSTISSNHQPSICLPALSGADKVAERQHVKAEFGVKVSQLWNLQTWTHAYKKNNLFYDNCADEWLPWLTSSHGFTKITDK